MALIGQWVFKAGGTTMYSPSFPRGGLGAVFNATTLAQIGSPSLTITVEHKNHDDTTWASLGAFTLIATLGNFQEDLSGIKEEVRFAYAITGSQDYVGFLLLVTAPAWRPYA